jgi:hypothetical protein
MEHIQVIWQRARDGCYYTTINRRQIKLGRTMEEAKTNLPESLTTSLCEAALLISQHLSRAEAENLLNVIYKGTTNGTTSNNLEVMHE